MWAGPEEEQGKRKEGEGGKDRPRHSVGQAHVARERRVNGGQRARRLGLKIGLLVGLRLLRYCFLQSDPTLALVAYSSTFIFNSDKINKITLKS